MQLFSNRVSTAIQTFIMTCQLKSKTAPQTVKMIKKLNDQWSIVNNYKGLSVNVSV